MIGWQIFRHSLSMVLRNFGRALHIYAVPWLIAVAAVFLVVLAAGLPFDMLGGGVAEPVDASTAKLVLVFFAMFVIIVLTSLWIAVAWHRYVLLEETPQGVMPPIHQDRIAAYFGRGLLLFLAFLIPGAILAFLIATLVQISVGSAIFFGAILGFALAVLFYRLSVILPAAALGKKMSFSDALETTKGATGPIVVAGICFLILQIVTNFAASLLAFIPLVGFLASILTAMFLTMVGISILTTLYGVYVEKRELS